MLRLSYLCSDYLTYVMIILLMLRLSYLCYDYLTYVTIILLMLRLSYLCYDYLSYVMIMTFLKRIIGFSSHENILKFSFLSYGPFGIHAEMSLT